MAKTRYLQITDTMMFEYKMLGEGEYSQHTSNELIYVKMMDNHNAVFSPISCECEPYYENNVIKYKKKFEPDTLNTLNHLAVSTDSNLSMMYTFLDPDYEYVDSSIMSSIDPNQIKSRNYAPYLKEPDNPDKNPFGEYFTGIYNLRYDRMRLYFVNGYDFSNIYGMYVKVTVDQEHDNTSLGLLDLCNFFFNRDNAYMLIKYLASPILMGNDVYDRYIEVNLPCLYDLMTQKLTENHHEIFDILDVKENSTIKLLFSVILNEDVTLNDVEYKITDLVYSQPLNKKVNANFTRSNSIKGTVPTENIASDNLGCYIAEVPDKPYVQFYATWNNKPLTKEIVWSFNKGIILYDTSLIRKINDYDVSDDYIVEHSERKWLCMHELKLSFCMGDKIIKEETYSMNQIFVSDSDPNIFYYRPLIFDENVGLYIDNIQIVYTMRFMNTDDRVQFVKVASLSLLGNMGKYYAMSTNLTRNNMTPYKVYNKIEENKQYFDKNFGDIQTVKYTKVFYDSTNVTLDSGDGNYYSPYTYTLQMSQAPKSYKFVFKNKTSDGKLDYMDLTDGYYKLMFKDDSGATVLIEPTYSSNMNLYLGELEFNISSSHISKLTTVNEDNRKMSIVTYNDDGSVSSMYDFKYII